jgi:hypothetical protein
MISKNRKFFGFLFRYSNFLYFENSSYSIGNYLNPTDACQTNANRRKKTGIAGITSTIGRNAVYGSGKADNKKLISIIC